MNEDSTVDSAGTSVLSCRSLLLDMRLDGRSLALGTGFLMEPPAGPVLVTARHNFTNYTKSGWQPDEVAIHHNRLGAGSVWLEVLEPLLDVDGKQLWTEHPLWGSDMDVVALPLTNTNGVQLWPYRPGTEDSNIACQPPEQVNVIGFPFGKHARGFAIWSTGFVASEPVVDYEGLPRFLIDSRTREGQSGSPVIAYRRASFLVDGPTPTHVDMGRGDAARFLGVYTGRITKESDLGFVWKASAVAELLAAVPVRDAGRR